MKRNFIITEDLKSIVSSPLSWRRFSGKTLLVTGASGALGSYMVETLLYLNEELFSVPAKVVAVVRDLEKAKQRLSAYEGRSDLMILSHDVCEPLEINGDIHFIIHAASTATTPAFRLDPVGTMLPNILGTLHLLRLAVDRGAEGFLYFSSGAVYGRTFDLTTPFTERDFGYIDPVDVGSCYAESKRMAENMCACWLHQFGLQTKIVRPCHTYGPSIALDDGRVFSDFIRDIIAGGPITVKSDGSAVRTYCYVADATQGFYTVLLEGAAGEAYTVGDDAATISVIDLAKTLSKVFSHRGIQVVQDVNVGPNSPQSGRPAIVPALCVAKLAALGWRPQTSIEEGFRRSVESFM